MYLIFLDNREFEQGDFDSHIAYLRRWGGTPDCWGTAESFDDAIDDARHLAGNNDCSVMVVENCSYRTVYSRLKIS